MIYLILVTGLILIYFALKRDNKSSSMISQAMTKKIESDDFEIHSIREDLNYFMVKVEELESSIAIISEKLNHIERPMIENNDDHNNEIENFNEILQKNINEGQGIDTVLQKNNDTNDIRKKIFELYDIGKTVDEISSILRIGKGEVSLRLGLRKLNN